MDYNSAVLLLSAVVKQAATDIKRGGHCDSPTPHPAENCAYSLLQGLTLYVDNHDDRTATGLGLEIVRLSQRKP